MLAPQKDTYYYDSAYCKKYREEVERSEPLAYNLLWFIYLLWSMYFSCHFGDAPFNSAVG